MKGGTTPSFSALLSRGAVLREVNLLFVLAAVMMGPLFFSWRMARVRSALADRTSCPPPRYAGDSVPVELEWSNTRPGAFKLGARGWRTRRRLAETRECARRRRRFSRTSALASPPRNVRPGVPSARGRYRVRAAERRDSISLWVSRSEVGIRRAAGGARRSASGTLESRLDALAGTARARRRVASQRRGVCAKGTTTGCANGVPATVGAGSIGAVRAARTSDDAAI